MKLIFRPIHNSNKTKCGKNMKYLGKSISDCQLRNKTFPNSQYLNGLKRNIVEN